VAGYKEQGRELIYALDIGTRSIVGVVGTAEGDKLKVLDIEQAEHGRRAMLDGQIDDIGRVAALARTVTGRLEKRLKVRLRRVCVAAAGRALRTQKASFLMELPGDQNLEAEQISRLEAGAVSAAEEALRGETEGGQRLFLVGYTVSQYRLDNYPMANLLGHCGRRVEADVVATFLPGEVVESLYAAMGQAGLQVASMTLEPIAAMNAAIPAELRLLNLALVDIGAGTTDIALCKEGSVIGYTMATVAGDEITEAIMRTFLVDFQTAEQIKRGLKPEGEIVYKNILGTEERTTAQAVNDAIREPMDALAQAVSQQVLAVNGAAPSALFLAGGGSKLLGLREKVAQSLGMEEKRVAIAGGNFSMSACSDALDLDNPEYATPLGIAVSAGLGLLNDSYVVLLNDQPAKLFRSGALTLRDILLMNGYVYADMMAKTGKSLTVTLDGRRVSLRGEPAVPAVLQVNGADATLSTVVHAGDRIQFTPAQNGADARRTLGELLGEDFCGQAQVNGRAASLDTPLAQHDQIRTWAQAPLPEEKRDREEEMPVPQRSNPAGGGDGLLHVTLNQAPLTLEPKEGTVPYFLMDLLQYSDLNLDHLDSPVRLEVNGKEQGFQYELKENDSVTICPVPRAGSEARGDETAAQPL
jgi:cell division protein FtsA